MRALVPLCASLLFAASAAAQEGEGDTAPATPFDRAFAAAGENKPMQAIAILEQGVAAGEAGPETLAQSYSLIGEERRALEFFDRRWTAQDGDVDLSAYRPVPALPAIVSASRDARVVMINEAHHLSLTRAFAHHVMQELRAIGFTHFAAETFCNGCETLTMDGVPTTDTGYYTRDPVYGDLVREAVALGYELVPYEQTPGQAPAFPQAGNIQVALREEAQAQNLKAFLDANPQARLLVLVGFNHHNETAMGDGGEFRLMGARFKRMTGIDPLTIDQWAGAPHSTMEMASPLYRAAHAAFAIESPVVLQDSEGLLGASGADIAVIHPVPGQAHGRPDWLSMDGYRQPREVSFDTMDARTLIRAFVAGEPEDAIPMDQIIAPAGVESVTLMLPRGAYRLVRQTEAGEDLPLGDLSL